MDSQKVLRYTTDCIKYRIQEEMGSWPSEIHHSDGLHRLSDDLLAVACGECFNDFSIEKRNLRLIQQPIMYNCATLNPMIEATLPEYDSKTYGNSARARAIAAILQPLFVCGDEGRIETEIILDDKVWSKPVSMCSKSITETLERNNVHVQFFCHDSAKIPGLQLADLTAGVIHSFQVSGREREAHELIKDRFIAHIGARRVPGASIF